MIYQYLLVLKKKIIIYFKQMIVGFYATTLVKHTQQAFQAVTCVSSYIRDLHDDTVIRQIINKFIRHSCLVQIRI